MKLNSRTKKILFISMMVIFVFYLSGCAAPMDENRQTIYIWNEVVQGEGTFRTSFKDVLSNESWFQALIVYPLTWLINNLAPKISVGGAVAVVTFGLNTLLALATFKSTMASQKMQTIQPEIQRIQRKYEGKEDQASRMRMSNEMNALYKKYDINPMGTILITFLQFPIIIAMYQAVHRSYAVQKGVFLGMTLQTPPLTGIKQLFSGYMTGLPYLLLFIFMAVCQSISMFLPRYLQKKKAAEDAAKHHRKPVDTSSQMDSMQYMMLAMILVFGLTWPSAMSLYWAIYSLFNIIKTLVTQRLIDNSNKEAKA